MTNSIDFLVVGNGLAGSLLAWQLMQHDQRVAIVDHDSGKSASLTAAGLMNPITGKRFVKDPHFDEFASVAKAFYQTLEGFFDTRVFFEKSLIRIFRSEQEQASWQQKKLRSDFKPYLGDSFRDRIDRYDLDAPFEGYHQRFCGRLDIVLMLNKITSFFKHTGRFINASLSNRELVKNDSGYSWRGYTIKQIVFCEGYRSMHNPLFSWLPFQPSKGEVLTIKTDRTLPDEIISRGKWLLPLGNGVCTVGSTYQWAPIDEKPSDSAKRELLLSFENMFGKPVDFDCKDHKAGVRPNTLDKQPFIGRHPVTSQISIFNGFGSKGALTIPWYASRFVEYLLKGMPLPSEADIVRYYATHFPGKAFS